MATLLPAAPVDVPRIVIDSNAVLDWLYFRDPRCAALAEAVTSRRVQWVASAAMRDEIEHVLARDSLGRRWPDGAASVREGWQRWATMLEQTPALAPLALRCSDEDDQKFIDLALATRAVALLSADRAVLRLARRASACRLAAGVTRRPAARQRPYPPMCGHREGGRSHRHSRGDVALSRGNGAGAAAIRRTQTPLAPGPGANARAARPQRDLLPLGSVRPW